MYKLITAEEAKMVSDSNSRLNYLMRTISLLIDGDARKGLYYTTKYVYEYENSDVEKAIQSLMNDGYQVDAKRSWLTKYYKLRVSWHESWII